MRRIHPHDLQIMPVQTEHAVFLRCEQQDVYGAVRHIHAVDRVDFIGDT